MRLAAYAGASVALAAGVFVKALHQRSNFYSACVYLSQSSANLMILTNLCLLIVGLLLYWLQRLLYGPLRPIETEQLYEKAWFAVTETCLAMTIFRGELGGWFLVMFICLLVGKVWGWIGEGRVEYLEQQPPANPRVFHTRLTASLVLSVLFNSFMLRYCVHTVLEQARPDMMVMFGFEFAILSILSCSTAARYGISLVEIYVTQQQKFARIEERRAELRAAREEATQQEAQTGESVTNVPDDNDIDEMELDIPGWEEKGRWVFYLDLVTDFFKLIVYLTFFAILFTFYGLPIHILRDVVLTIRSFGRRIMDFIRYRNATRDMNERYPDATTEEVTGEDVCIICREEMIPWQPDQPGRPGARRVPERLRPKKLPCGHILHFACLRSWLERQQNCPTCRSPVVVPRNRGQAGEVAPQQNIPGGNQGNGAGGLPRARIYQFGPFRIGFGAGRGDVFHNLQQQIHQGNAAMQPAANIPAGARQVGFGFGFGRPPAGAVPAPAPAQAPTPVAAPTPTPTTQPSFSATPRFQDMQSQLQHMEQQIIHEIDQLRLSAHQLQVVRLLQAELQRLRNQQATTPGLNPAFSQNPPPFTSPSPLPSTVTSRHQFISSPRATPMTAGDARLPDGLTLPQGWSLIPLHSAAQQSGEQREQRNTDATLHSAPEPTTNASPEPSSSTLHVPVVSEPPSSNLESEDRRDENTEASNTATTQNLPNWSSGLTAGPDSHRVESPANDWNGVASYQPTEKVQGPSAAADEGEQEAGPSNVDETSSTSSKGKGRAATVEDADDDEA
ncbi:hypothetical protein SI65_04774 [Aspergillus cristatus]|uniref:RING-type E3 ubiquitin transferase n=1 Tax=Aspergillus cristatus TaxID=573508 RepID=A0A1E3BFX5_ASPCR|nr:hypothetical protein SI65_04774 [Aspergillus cristatus]